MLLACALCVATQGACAGEDCAINILPLRSESPLTIVTTLKPCEPGTHTWVIQRNALHAWSHMRGNPRVIIFGDDKGAATLAAETGAELVPQVSRHTKYNLPLLDGLFHSADALATTPVVMFTNADLMYMDDVVDAVDTGLRNYERFMMVARRWNVPITDELDFAADWQQTLTTFVTSKGSQMPANMWAIDTFVNSR